MPSATDSSSLRPHEFEVSDPTHGTLSATALSPDAPQQAIIFLYGGGGHASMLFDLAPAFQAALERANARPTMIACLNVPPFCFYLDDPAADMAWEHAVGKSLVTEVRNRLGQDEPLGLVGISMGGYGALKIAFAQPDEFASVAAVSPMLEPSADGSAPLRNRFHYPPNCPTRLVGSERDLDLVRRDHPATRAHEHHEQIKANHLHVYIDAGSRDALNAHDGAEYLHRELWSLDIVHEYRLRRDADHVGADVLPRLQSAIEWVGGTLGATPTEDAEAEALRAVLAPMREAAVARDPSTRRTYGALPQS